MLKWVRAAWVHLRATIGDAGVRVRLIAALAEQSTYTGLQGVALFVGLTESRFAAVSGALVFVFGMMKVILPDRAASPGAGS